MPQVIETTVYTFNELSDKAKEKAREWFRESGIDYEWYDSVYEDAKECGKILGIEIDNIYFSGFWSQGDGACFEGRYAYRTGSLDAIKAHAPTDAILHSIAHDLRDIQSKRFYSLEASVKVVGRYCHSNSTEIEVFDKDGDCVDVETHDLVAKQLRRFMDWIYRRLGEEYNWLNADEQVDETIIANEYTFTENGRRF